MKKVSEQYDRHFSRSNRPDKSGKRSLPPLVVSRAKFAGAVGEAWLASLDSMISELEELWDITVGNALSGGTHAFVADADGRNGKKYVLKIDMPENLGGEFSNGIAALKIADGRGYAKLYAYDPARKACLLERLGTPVNQLGLPVYEQLRIICSALQKAWEIPAAKSGLPGGKESVAWFRAFIGETWGKLGHPCSREVIDQAFSYLQSREDAINPSEFVLLHGDAHGGNTLKTLSGKGYKLIDPDGIVYEKAYDLGVLMREWVDEYRQEPLKIGKKRCAYLHRLTGVSEKAIWEWGFLQTVSTAFVLLQIGQEETGQKMLRVAECWACEKDTAEPAYPEELAAFLSSEYDFHILGITPAKRGFYGETWNVQTESARYFVKIDDWQHHKKSFQNSLPVVQYLTDSGISFIPKIIKTKDGRLSSGFRQGVAAVFEYIPGELSEHCSVEQIYRRLSEVYLLGTTGLNIERETFDTEPIRTFQNLQRLSGWPAAVRKALSEKEPVISRYIERLKRFSAVCKNNPDAFYITHGDAGGNCILNGNRLFLVDWDSVMLAPIERDAWIYLCEQQQIDKINSILAENGIRYTLEKNRLCFYCYAFFFHYLNEYLKAIAGAKNEAQKAEITRGLLAYLTDNWIYKRLAAAERIEPASGEETD